MKTSLLTIAILLMTISANSALIDTIRTDAAQHEGYTSGIKLHYSDVVTIQEKTAWKIQIPGVALQFIHFLQDNPKAYLTGYYVGPPRSKSSTIITKGLHVPKGTNITDICKTANYIYFHDDGEIVCDWGTEEQH